MTPARRVADARGSEDEVSFPRPIVSRALVKLPPVCRVGVRLQRHLSTVNTTDGAPQRR
jgi:hypothetical protein